MSKSYRKSPVYTGRKPGSMKEWKRKAAKRIRQQNKVALRLEKELLKPKEITSNDIWMAPTAPFYFGNIKESWVNRLWRK